MDASWVIVVQDHGKVIRTMISCHLEFTLCRGGMLNQVKTKLEKYGIDIAAVQEITRKWSGMLDTGNFILM
jgi:hypothetical protein